MTTCKRDWIPWLIVAAIFLTWKIVIIGATPGLVKVQTEHGHGSGVCVSPDGWIVTCRHVVTIGNIPQKNCMVIFSDGLKRMASIPIVGNTPDYDLALVKTDGTDLPYTLVSHSGPAAGERCSIEGFPGGNLGQMNCVLTKTEPANTKAGQPERSFLNCRAQSGNSGGPVLNSQGEVCGIVFGVPADGPIEAIGGIVLPKNDRFETYAMGHTEICNILSRASEKGHHIAMLAMRPGSYRPSSPLKPRLVVLCLPNCAPCEAFKRDSKNPELRAAMQAAFRVRIVDGGSVVRFAEKYGVKSYPAFIMSNANRIIEGYQGPAWLEDQISRAVDGSPPAIQQKTEFDYRLDDEPDGAIPQPQPLLPQQPITVPAPAPVSPLVEEEEQQERPTKKRPDTSGVRVVVTVKKSSLSFLMGQVVTRAEQWATGPFTQSLKERIPGVNVDVVFERTSPGRYAAVNRAAKVDTADSSYFNAIVLAPQSFRGDSSFLSSITGAAINAIPFRNLGEFHSVHVIMERFRGDDYANTIAAISAADGDADDSSGWLVTGAGGLGGAWALMNFLKNRKLASMLHKPEGAA